MRLGLTRGTEIRIVRGSHAGRTGTVEAKVFQKTVDSNELSQQNSGYVFTQISGAPISPDGVSKDFCAIVRKAQ